MNKEQIDAYRDFAKEKLGFDFKNIERTTSFDNALNDENTT